MNKREETLLKELIPVKDKIEKLNEHMKQIIEYVMVLEQRLNSIEIRVKNIEKSKR